MNRLKKIIVITLLGVNVLLLAVLVHVNMDPAKAAPFKTTDYAVSTGKVAGSADALYIVDRATERMVAVTLDPTTKKLRRIGTVQDLGRIFSQ